MRLSGCVALFAMAVATGGLLAATDIRAADSRPSEPAPCTCPNDDGAPKRSARPKYAELQGSLGEDEEIATLEAIRVALTEMGDGAPFVWRHRAGRIAGVVTPTSSFKDADGRICRHIVLVLAAGRRMGKIEGIACRLGDGRWELDG